MKIKFENELDKIIFTHLIETAISQKTKSISFNVSNFIEMGYDLEEIKTNIERIKKIDAIKLFEETKDISNMTMQ